MPPSREPFRRCLAVRFHKSAGRGTLLAAAVPAGDRDAYKWVMARFYRAPERVLDSAVSH
jgi:hypothetical protein